mmetsp:Transcript_81969/g.198659  ORF Transcript_81969/g.198659 Transcript_81969/m.198659 type:complete len:283 (-) Transcript_81969:719-1567(-)
MKIYLSGGRSMYMQRTPLVQACAQTPAHASLPGCHMSDRGEETEARDLQWPVGILTGTSAQTPIVTAATSDHPPIGKHKVGGAAPRTDVHHLRTGIHCYLPVHTCRVCQPTIPWTLAKLALSIATPAVSPAAGGGKGEGRQVARAYPPHGLWQRLHLKRLRLRLAAEAMAQLTPPASAPCEHDTVLCQCHGVVATSRDGRKSRLAGARQVLLLQFHLPGVTQLPQVQGRASCATLAIVIASPGKERTCVRQCKGMRVPCGYLDNWGQRGHALLPCSAPLPCH